MGEDKKTVTIKKYANRRLYNTGTSSYVTLEDLAGMVKVGEDFVVFDAKSGEEITRSVLTQIIFEQEGKEGQSLLPVTFLRQLIRFYGDNMQALVPSYLQYSIQKLTDEQHNFRDHVANAFGATVFPTGGFAAMEEQARVNMAMFSKALSMFTPFVPAERPAPPPAAAPQSDLDGLRDQLAAMQRQLDKLSKP